VDDLLEEMNNLQNTKGDLFDKAKPFLYGRFLRGHHLEALGTQARQRWNDDAAHVAVHLLTFSNVRRRQLEYLVLLLLDIVDDETLSPQVRGQAAEGVGNHLETTKQAKLRRVAALRLLQRLRDPEPEVRFWSAFALGSVRAKQARKALRRLGSDQTIAFQGRTVGSAALEALSLVEQ
jgi:uncharacterized protein (UPF0147 family)